MSTAGVGTVTASVGGTQTAALFQRLQAQQARTAALEGRLEAGNTELEQRLAALEAENVRLRERVPKPAWLRWRPCWPKNGGLQRGSEG